MAKHSVLIASDGFLEGLLHKMAIQRFAGDCEGHGKALRLVYRQVQSSKYNPSRDPNGVQVLPVSVRIIRTHKVVYWTPMPLIMAGIIVQDDLQDTVTKLSHFTLTRYANTAACTLVIYDLLLTLDDTLGYVCKGNLSLPKVLYYITRYTTPPLILVVTHRIPLPLDDDYCKRLAWVAGAGQILINGCSLFIMSLRVRAIWRAHQIVTLCIRIFYTLGWVTTLIFVFLSLQMIQKYTVYYALADTCYADNRIPHMFLVTLIPLTIEVVFTTLTAVKTYQNVRQITMTPLPPLLRIFIRDGFLYFCTISVLGIGNALIWILLPSTLIYFGLYIYFACVTTFICRFYVNLLKVAGLKSTRKTMSSTLSTSLESRSRRDRLIFGDGEFEVTDSMLERHGFLRDEDGDGVDQETAQPFASSTPNMGSSSSTLAAGQRAGWG